MHVANNLDVNDSTGVVVMTYLAIITHKLISRLDSKREVLPVIEYRYIWAYYAHGRQRRCQEDPVSPPPPPAEWRRQPGRPCIMWLSTVQQDLKQHHLTLPEAADFRTALCGG